MICPTCHAEISDDALFCSSCGTKIEPVDAAASAAVCPQCGAELAPGALFCSHCGASVAPAGVPAAVPMADDAAQAAAALWGDGQGATPTRRALVCPSCGAPVSPTDPYCPACGVRLLGSRAGSPQSAPSAQPSADTTMVDIAREAVAPADPRLRSGSTGPMPRVAVPAPSAASSHDDGEKPRRHVGKTVGIVVGVIAVAALAGGGLWYALDAQRQQDEATQQAEQATQALHSVTIAVAAEGWNTDEGASRLPVRVVGTNSTGEAVDETQYVTTAGTGLMLRQGSYQLSVAGSPIAADGTVYTVPDTVLDITVATDNPGDAVDVTSQGSFTLTPIDALEVTDDQILAAAQLAAADTADGHADADTLRAAAVQRREDAAAAQQEQQEQEQESYDSRHVVADSYEFYMPSYWDGRVTVQVDGDHVSVCSAKYPDLELFNVTVQRGTTQAVGDVGYACLGDVALGDGTYASVWARRWGWLIGYAYMTNSTDPNDYYTMDEAEEIVDLQTGGNVTYESIRDEMVANDGNSDLVFVTDDYLYACIVESLQPLE